MYPSQLGSWATAHPPWFPKCSEVADLAVKWDPRGSLLHEWGKIWDITHGSGILSFSKDADGGGPNAQWPSASRGRTSQLGPHCTLEPSEAPLHPLSTLCPHSEPEWVLFQPQDGGNQLKGPRQPWPGGKAVPQGPFSRRTSALAVLSCPAWKLKHRDCTTSCCHFCFSERIFSSFLKAVLSEPCRALHPAPRSRDFPLAGTQSCWLAGWMDKWILVEGLIYTKLVEAHRSAR